MKKSLVIISFAFIFLLGVSFVSANFFDWITGDALKETGSDSLPTSTSPTLTLKEGKTAELSSTSSLEITKVEGDTVIATVTNTKTGVQEQISLQKDGIAQLNDGTVLRVSDTKESGFLTRAKATISVSSPSDGLAGTAGTEGATFSSQITQAVPFTKGEYTIGEDTWVLEGEEETLTLTINGLYNAELIKGRTYDIPAFCSGNHRVTISEAGEMTIDTTTNTIPAVASQF